MRIRNSQGIRVPRTSLEEAGLGDEAEVRVTDAGIVLEAFESSRSEWAEAARELASNERDTTDVVVPTELDEAEWEW